MDIQKQRWAYVAAVVGAILISGYAGAMLCKKNKLAMCPPCQSAPAAPPAAPPATSTDSTAELVDKAKKGDPKAAALLRQRQGDRSVYAATGSDRNPILLLIAILSTVLIAIIVGQVMKGGERLSRLSPLRSPTNMARRGWDSLQGYAA